MHEVFFFYYSFVFSSVHANTQHRRHRCHFTAGQPMSNYNMAASVFSPLMFSRSWMELRSSTVKADCPPPGY